MVDAGNSEGLDDMLKRSPPVYKRARIKARKVTPIIVQQVKAYKRRHKKQSHFEIATKFQVTDRLSKHHQINHRTQLAILLMPLQRRHLGTARSIMAAQANTIIPTIRPMLTIASNISIRFVVVLLAEWQAEYQPAQIVLA